MAKRAHSNLLKLGVEAWNQQRLVDDDFHPDLNGMRLMYANLAGINFSNVPLVRAELPGAYLRQADLRGCDLRKADLHSADLRAANLSGAILRGANLTRANLMGAVLAQADLFQATLCTANFRNADLTEADLTYAILNRTLFMGTNLSGTTGLETCIHLGPSIIKLQRTLVAKLPPEFLHGCEVPESFIERSTSQRTPADARVPVNSCFISYSTVDQAFADRLHADLQKNGVRCWFAPKDVHIGEKLHDQIEQAIRIYDRLLLILSEHSTRSEWVQSEIALARQKEVKEHRQVLFPISLMPFARLREWKCFDADTGKDSAREIREYFIPDFSNWKDDCFYQELFQRLLKRLLG